ncbi:MAG: DUF4445 domain-containing protein [Lentisphaerae bacterium]|jgi:uncharacterized 2Fe-2S/4Fe-4S cluster protein (DUF4445 family)|nr:DUF4445 domain-containing protein [Lentisphaerota bacterium]
MEKQIKITFQPQGRSLTILPGTSILEAAARAGLVIETPCGGMGTCGKCRVQITQGDQPPTPADIKFFSATDLNQGWRLACQGKATSDLVITVPESSLFGRGHQIMSDTDASVATPQKIDSGIRKCYVELEHPSLTDDAPDLLRLEQQVGPFKTSLKQIRNVSATLRTHDFKGTAVLSGRHLIDFQAGNTSKNCYGVAFDIGTTTLAGELLNLCDGSRLGVVSRMNPQVSFGDDVLSRIRHATAAAYGLEEMRQAVINEINAIIDALSLNANIRRNDIYTVAFAGNTTMSHILCGLHPAQLGETPFVPMHGRGLIVNASELGLQIHHYAPAYIFPTIGGFVGGDTVACLVSTRLDRYEKTTLLVDIGTNGEIVLAHKGQFLGASTAAGPAFEGARIACGMRGTRGAIEKAIFNDDLQIEVIGGGNATGICGSGLIDIIAQLLNSGIVTSDGQMLPRSELPQTIPPALADRVCEDENGDTYFLLAESTDATSTPVILTQRDIREVQLASGAVRTGITLLLRQAGLTMQDLNTVLIAGGFGNYIDRQSAQRIGLLPGGISHEQIRYVGNASLAGARVALLSDECRRLGEDLARSVRHIELSTLEGFHDAFVEAMFFPED